MRIMHKFKDLLLPKKKIQKVLKKIIWDSHFELGSFRNTKPGIEVYRLQFSWIKITLFYSKLNDIILKILRDAYYTKMA